MPPDLSHQALVFFLKLAESRSLSTAAVLLGISASKASRILQQLRQAFGDPLFLRKASGLMPTARTQALLPLVREAAARYEALFDASPAFRPVDESRIFRITAIDSAIFSFVLPSLAKICQLSPRIGFDFRTIREIAADFRRDLLEGRVDLIICPDPEERPGFRMKRICTDTWVFVVSPESPLAAIKNQRPLSGEDFRGFRFSKMLLNPYVNIRNDIWSGTDKDLPQQASAFSLWSPSMLLTWSAAMSDPNLVAVLPIQFALRLAQMAPLVILGRPSGSPVLHPTMLWHERSDSDLAFQWLRGMLSNDHEQLPSEFDLPEISI